MHDNKSITICIVLFMVLVFATFLINGISNINANSDPSAMDTPGYLRAAMNIKQTGGITAFFGNCIDGSYMEFNQHPLYLLMLSAFVERSFESFVNAKVLTFVIGLAALLSYLFICSRLFNFPVAVASCALLSWNAVFLRLTTMVACESLVMLCFLWCLYFLFKDSERAMNYALAGIFCGLAYLTKATGLFLLGGIMLGFVMVHKRGIFKAGSFWLFIFGFVMCASPLLIRNTIVFHNPIYNLNWNVMWLDSWDEFFTVAFKEAREQHTIFWYMKSHTISDVVMRFITGIKLQWDLLFQLYLPAFGYKLRYVYFYAALFFFMIGVINEQRQRRVFIVMILGLYLLLFSWFGVILAAERYLLPVFPLFLVYSVYGAYAAIKAILGSTRKASVILLSCMCIYSIPVSVKAFVERDLAPVHDSYAVKPGYDDLMAWISENVKGAHIMFGVGETYQTFYAGRFSISSMPLVDTMQELHQYCRDHDVRYVMIDSIGIEKRDILSEFFQVGDQGIIINELPTGWDVVYKDPSGENDYVVCEIVGGG